MNFRKTKRRPDLTLDLMPLIDVVFLLLIFFLITTSFTQEQQRKIPINLPQGVTGTEVGEGTKVILFVTENGEIELEADFEVNGSSLDEKLKSLKALRPDASILLKGDTSAEHGKVVETLDTIKNAGFEKVDLVITKTE